MEVQQVERILLTTEFTKDGYIAKCITNNNELITGAYPDPHTAINHLVNVVVKRKQEIHQMRDVHYMFTTKF